MPRPPNISRTVSRRHSSLMFLRHNAPHAGRLTVRDWLERRCFGNAPADAFAQSIRPLRPIYCRNSRCGEMRIDELIGVCDASGGKWIGDLDVAVGGLAA